MSTDTDFDIDAGDELSRPAPTDRIMNRGWAELVKPLVDRIAKLDNNKCIRIKKSLTPSLVSAVRTGLMQAHAFKLITRSMPGEMYFWRGEKVVGTKEDLIRRDERLAANG